MSNVKFIYSLRIHILLQRMGFIPLAELDNPNNSKYKCWAYEATDELLQAFDDILRNDRGYHNG